VAPLNNALQSKSQTSLTRRWLLTGVAGFIGSHLLEYLLRHGQEVVGLDNLSTGHRANLDDVRSRLSEGDWKRFQFVEGDITREQDVARAMEGVELVLHQAALGSVPKSIEDPLSTHASNVTGFVHILNHARLAGVKRVVYASSSAVYGDAEDLPAREDRIGRPLSPYAVSKRMNEQYAEVFERCYGLVSVGLRYFNVFGPRQDPQGAYAAVIPRWIAALLKHREVEIYGDGETSRDFCHVDNIVHANVLAATADLPSSGPRVFNVGLGRATSLNELFQSLRAEAARLDPSVAKTEAARRPFREGDIRHSCADAGRIRDVLGFAPVKEVAQGLAETVRWFASR
jgi:UDP-N-acetylglucosamine 4-epimerase